jgi:hypothetical protein
MPINNLNKSTASNFELAFPLIPTESDLHALEGLTMNIHGTVIPSMTLETTEVAWQGGVAHYDIGTLTFEPWYVNFTIDSEFDNFKKLYKWLTFINNNKDRFGRPRDEYKVDAVLRVLNNFRQEIMVIDIRNVWINMLGEMQLTYREGDTNLESQANFIYDRYEIRNI